MLSGLIEQWVAIRESLGVIKRPPELPGRPKTSPFSIAGPHPGRHVTCAAHTLKARSDLQCSTTKQRRQHALLFDHYVSLQSGATSLSLQEASRNEMLREFHFATHAPHVQHWQYAKQRSCQRDLQSFFFSGTNGGMDKDFGMAYHFMMSNLLFMMLHRHMPLKGESGCVKYFGTATRGLLP